MIEALAVSKPFATGRPTFLARLDALRQQPLLDPRVERARVLAALLGEPRESNATATLVSKPRRD